MLFWVALEKRQNSINRKPENRFNGELIFNSTIECASKKKLIVCFTIHAVFFLCCVRKALKTTVINRKRKNHVGNQ